MQRFGSDGSNSGHGGCALETALRRNPRGGRKWRPDSSMPEKASGNDELLNFAGSVENPKSPGMPKQTFDCRTANDAKATKNLYSLINDVEGSFS
jgi:hypothetical protein